MSKTTFLEFEQPIAELEGKIEELRYVQDESALRHLGKRSIACRKRARR